MYSVRSRIFVASCAALATGFVAALAPSAEASTVSSIASNFNGTAIASGNQIWFSAVLNPSGVPASGVSHLLINNSTITFTANATNFTIPVPDALITFDSSRNSATPKSSTSFVGGTWQTILPTTALAGNQLLDAVDFAVPAGGLPGGIQNVTWTGSFTTDTSGITLNWQWAAAVYTPTLYSGDYNAIKVKPVDDNSSSVYLNSDHAGAPEATGLQALVTGGATGGGGSNVTGSLSATKAVVPSVGPVPEPSSVALLAIGAACLCRRSRRNGQGR